MNNGMNKDQQFLGAELSADENKQATALFEIIPCGLEATVSYGAGAGQGAAAMIAASHQLERLVDGVEACKAGIFTHPPMNCAQPIERVIDDLRHLTAGIAAAGHIPVTLGGEHSLSYGAAMGVADSIGEIGIIQIDAHADFRPAYQGQKHSHASVMHLLASEGLPIASFGVRALCQQEHEARTKHGVIAYDGGALVRQQISAVTLPDDFPQKLYVTFDLDGLDPSVLPATGTPVPGGLGYYQAIDLVASALAGRQCVGLDVVELAPIEGQPASDFTAAQLTYQLMALIFLSPKRALEKEE